jgi:putative FmdB family regulatory protein
MKEAGRASPTHDTDGSKPAQRGQETKSQKEDQTMPLYEYECQNCGHVFEVFTQRREVAAQPRCPACGKANAQRVLSSFSGKVSDSAGCGTASGPG